MMPVQPSLHSAPLSPMGHSPTQSTLSSKTATKESSPDDLATRLAAMEKAIETSRKELGVPGASLVVVKDGKVVYMQGLGLRDVDHKQPVTPDTLFAIGSSTKAFTAMTAMMSVDDGKLSLTDSPKKYLPYFKLQDPDVDAKITISDLLCHRSGLARTDIAWGSGKLTSEEVIRIAGQAKPTAKLGEKFQYQNVMFLAAGQTVGAAQKQPWTTVLAKRILKPLGMNATNTSIAAMQRAPDFALGYRYDAETKQSTHLPMRNLESIAPAGAINSSARDMAHWLQFLLAGGVTRGKRLVSQKSFGELFKKHMSMGGKMDYGYGWMLEEWQGHRVAEHGGNIDGFSAEVALMPDQRLGFALLTNANTTPLASLARETIWQSLLGAPPKREAAKPVVPALDPAKEVGVYRLAAANLDVAIALKDNILTLTVPGQPTYNLENVGGRRYKLSVAPRFLRHVPAREGRPDADRAVYGTASGQFHGRESYRRTGPTRCGRGGGL